MNDTQTRPNQDRTAPPTHPFQQNNNVKEQIIASATSDIAGGEPLSRPGNGCCQAARGRRRKFCGGRPTTLADGRPAFNPSLCKPMLSLHFGGVPRSRIRWRTSPVNAGKSGATSWLGCRRAWTAKNVRSPICRRPPSDLLRPYDLAITRRAYTLVFTFDAAENDLHGLRNLGALYRELLCPSIRSALADLGSPDSIRGHVRADQALARSSVRAGRDGPRHPRHISAIRTGSQISTSLDLRGS